MNCGATITRETIVGSNGQFSFQFGGENRFAQVFPDASQGYEQPAGDYEQLGSATSRSGYYSGDMQKQRFRRMIGCEMRAQLSGYRSTVLSMREEPQQGPNDIGIIVLYPTERVQGSMVSITNLLVPKSAKKSVENARKAVQRQKGADAEGLFKSAIQEYPKYAEAWFDLGSLYEDQGRIVEARDAYREAVHADALYLKPYIRLGQLALAGRNWREASDLVDKALELDSINLVEAYLVSALAHFNLSEFDLSEKRARLGQRMDFSHRYPQLYLVLANISAVRKDYDGCVRELKSYLKSAPNAPDASFIRARVQQLEEATNRASAPR
jgi:lipopolysaccharide biosynthesis regulator YciM